MRKALSITTFLVLVPFALAGLGWRAPAFAAPPVPTWSHPRLFMTAQQLADYTTATQDPKSAASAQVARCQQTIDHPEYYMPRGGADADTWPGAALACAFAYTVTKQSNYLTQAIKYWQAALDDDQNLGDKLGCIAGVDTNWQPWETSGESGAKPPVLITIVHDTGYPMRWYGPYIALTYDWLYSAPGVSSQLLSQTRTCLTAWLDYYSKHGFNHDHAGANYGAGFTVGKALAGVAIGMDGGADGHLWNEANDNEYGKIIVGQGLAGLHGATSGMPVGNLVGGDAAEGWQYGPLSATEYAVGARALRENGADLTEMSEYTNSLVVRYIYGLLPTLDGEWIGGNGADYESSDRIYPDVKANPLAAVLAGPSSDQAAAWAIGLKQKLQQGAGTFIYNVFAEQRVVPPQDYLMSDPPPPLWYLARGTRTMYVRTSWGADAYWGVFSSPPLFTDHQHFSASNFVFSRGADHLIVDPSQYNAFDTFQSNGISADAKVVPGDYAKSQTPWSKADLPWARASDSNVFAARSDLAHAFDYNGTDSDIPYAHREWVFLPEGEIVAIDRVETADAAHVMYLNFHANTGGTLTIGGSVASGTVGGSKVVIHPVLLSGGSPTITQPPKLGDSNSCTGGYPNGTCKDGRFANDIYTLNVPGPSAKAIHVIDGLAADEAPATVASLNDPNYDPMSDNGGVIGAAVYRAMKQSYVVASSAARGASGDSMTYSVPGTPGRHIVFDAPEAADGSSTVTAAAAGGRCAITITAGSGGGLTGHPLMFAVAAADSGCTVTESTDVPTGSTPPPATPIDIGHGGNGGGGGGGCGCAIASGGALSSWLWLIAAATIVWIRRHGGRRHR